LPHLRAVWQSNIIFISSTASARRLWKFFSECSLKSDSSMGPGQGRVHIHGGSLCFHNMLLYRLYAHFSLLSHEAAFILFSCRCIELLEPLRHTYITQQRAVHQQGLPLLFHFDAPKEHQSENCSHTNVKLGSSSLFSDCSQKSDFVWRYIFLTHLIFSFHINHHEMFAKRHKVGSFLCVTNFVYTEIQHRVNK